MNDRYLYRGKRTDNGEWVEGHLITDMQDKDKCFIGYVFGTNDDGTPHDFDIVPVDPSTLCQCTGLKDKNGKLIWESDILKGFDYPFLSDGDFNYYAVAEWVDGWKYFCLVTVKNPKSLVCGISTGNAELLQNFDGGKWEIIGNVFDNPELLEAK